MGEGKAIDGAENGCGRLGSVSSTAEQGERTEKDGDCVTIALDDWLLPVETGQKLGMLNAASNLALIARLLFSGMHIAISTFLSACVLTINVSI